MSKSAILPYRFLLACMWRITFIIISIFNRIKMKKMRMKGLNTIS